MVEIRAYLGLECGGDSVVPHVFLHQLQLHSHMYVHTERERDLTFSL